MRRVALAGLIAAVFAAPGSASAAVYAKVVGADGRVLAAGSGASFDYPADGSIVHVGSASASVGGESLNDVRLLAGLVFVDQIDVFANGSVGIGTVAAGGRIVSSAANGLVQLGSLGYLVMNQRAVSGSHVGRVALRLVLQQNDVNVAAGTEVLVGTPFSRTPAKGRSGPAIGGFDPLSVLGLGGAFDGLGGFAPPPSATAGSIGERAVAIAEQFLGVPYVWGGASPIPGFDCSGLAMYAYAQLGIHLTHYTGAQYWQGLRIPYDALAPGDLVFFDQNSTLGPQHEGIYIGNGRFIQAPHTGDVVKISSLADPLYGFSFVGAVRPYDKPD